MIARPNYRKGRSSTAALLRDVQADIRRVFASVSSTQRVAVTHCARLFVKYSAGCGDGSVYMSDCVVPPTLRRSIVFLGRDVAASLAQILQRFVDAPWMVCALIDGRMIV
jgi:hypothetical protein